MKKHIILIASLLMPQKILCNISLKADIGPAWNFFYTRLIPQPSALPAVTVSNANTQSSWNLLPIIFGSATLPLFKNINLKTGLELGWLRNGEAVITNSNAGFLTTGGRDLFANAFVNMLDFNIAIEYVLTHKKLPVITTAIGYNLMQEFNKLTLINEPLIFFARITYPGAFFSITLEQEIHDKISCALQYKFIGGTNRLRLSQTPGDIIVLRKIPMTLTNIFDLEFTYAYNDNLSFKETISYCNIQNYKQGYSTTYLSGVQQPTIKNVDSETNKQLEFLTSIIYTF